MGGLASAFIIVVSGFVIPLPFFPETLQRVFLALPFAGIVQTPTDIFLQRVHGLDLLLALGHQVLWAVVMLAGAQLFLVVATRRVVVQGG